MRKNKNMKLSKQLITAMIVGAVSVATLGVTSVFAQDSVYNGTDYSAVYDYNYYKDNNGDVASAFGDNESEYLEHFVNYGMPEGRQASTSFNPVVYEYEYGDLHSAFGDNLTAYYDHYIHYGEPEGRTAAYDYDFIKITMAIYSQFLVIINRSIMALHKLRDERGQTGCINNIIRFSICWYRLFSRIRL